MDFINKLSFIVYLSVYSWFFEYIS